MSSLYSQCANPSATTAKCSLLQLSHFLGTGPGFVSYVLVSTNTIVIVYESCNLNVIAYFSFATSIMPQEIFIVLTSDDEDNGSAVSAPWIYAPRNNGVPDEDLGPAVPHPRISAPCGIEAPPIGPPPLYDDDEFDLINALDRLHVSRVDRSVYRIGEGPTTCLTTH